MVLTRPRKIRGEERAKESSFREASVTARA
jgi:hypothetical protein